MDNTNFIDQEGHIIKTSPMKDEHQLVKITEKTPTLQNIGKIVRGDTNSNIITFEINRYYDNVDLLQKNIRFIVKNGEDIFIENAVNLQYNAELLRFSWVLSRLVTYKVGTIIAAIEFYSEIDEKCDYSLKTIPFEINIENTLDISDINITEENSTISTSPVPIASVAKNNNISIFTVTDKNGTTTAEILDGKDGITPHIDPETKHWFIDEEDTGISAEGADGITPVINASDKHWHIGGVDTGIIAEGQDGVTPHIDSATKHWFIGNTDTGITAEGKDGLQGDPGQNGTTYTPNIGTITSLASNQNATVNVSVNENTKTATFDFGIPKGKDGVGIEKIERIDSVGLVDTYKITLTNETGFEFSVTNGENGSVKIESISVNGTKIEPDTSKNVEITIPTTLPASDVPEWAKQPDKPTYTAAEVGADPSGSALAAKSYTDTKIQELIGTSPENLDTIYELAQAILDNQDVVDTINEAITNKVSKEEGKGLSTNDLTDEMIQRWDNKLSADEVDDKINSSTAISVVDVMIDSQWDGTEKPFTKSIAVTGVTANSFVWVMPQPNITEDQFTALNNATIIGGTQSTDTVELLVYGDKPTIDLPLRFSIMTLNKEDY